MRSWDGIVDLKHRNEPWISGPILHHLWFSWTWAKMIILLSVSATKYPLSLFAWNSSENEEHKMVMIPETKNKPVLFNQLPPTLNWQAKHQGKHRLGFGHFSRHLVRLRLVEHFPELHQRTRTHSCIKRGISVAFHTCTFPCHIKPGDHPVPSWMIHEIFLRVMGFVCADLGFGCSWCRWWVPPVL